MLSRTARTMEWKQMSSIAARPASRSSLTAATWRSTRSTSTAPRGSSPATPAPRPSSGRRMSSATKDRWGLTKSHPPPCTALLPRWNACNNAWINICWMIFFLTRWFLLLFLRCMNVTICDTSAPIAESPSALKRRCRCMKGRTRGRSLSSAPTAGPGLPRTLPSRCTAGRELSDDGWWNDLSEWSLGAQERQDSNREVTGFNL